MYPFLNYYNDLSGIKGYLKIKRIVLITTGNTTLSGTANVDVPIDISSYNFTGSVSVFLKATKFCSGYGNISSDKKTLTAVFYGVNVNTSKASLSFYLVEYF